jgi:hypothetical protein
MVKQSIQERRQALRAKRILSIQYRIIKSRAKEFDKRWHLSTTYDMSYLGLAFLSDIPVMVDDILELNVVMSGILDVFKGFGKVVRIDKKETGVFYLVAIEFAPSPKSSSQTTPKRKTAVKVIHLRKAIKHK